MVVRAVTLGLAAALLAVQVQLWFGSNGMGKVVALERQLADQQAQNGAAKQRNGRLAAEVVDLKEGLEMVEEKARSELGMVKPDEILVQYTKPR